MISDLVVNYSNVCCEIISIYTLKKLNFLLNFFCFDSKIFLTIFGATNDFYNFIKIYDIFFITSHNYSQKEKTKNKNDKRFNGHITSLYMEIFPKTIYDVIN